MDKFWKWLDGKKSHIAHLYWAFSVPAIAIIWPESVPVWIDKGSAILGLFLSAMGYGHKITKAVSK